ncbi:sensor histidine kinase [Actinoplanes flavus]|uniref:histidine kinase n=1 Tax=Actinoplanes flavus TaxID=2820290 RepID=A0ABS3US82_9ACTN|nr:histidine kinase [Actinoplanes flavus]MBO3741436.1 sensor histidine kinase [Actinoplanes flavus]
MRTRPWDPRLTDAALVLVCLALSVLAVKTPWSPLPWPVVAVSGALGSVAVWLRRRWPVAGAVTGAGTFALAGNPGPLLIGLYHGARYASRRGRWLCGLAAWAGFVGWSWFDTGRLTLDNVAFPPLGIGLVVLAGINLATRDELLASLQEQARRAESERLLRDEQARAAERTRIAREMHDVLAHKMSLIALYAGALELRATDDPKLRDGTVLIRTTAREALVDLREVLGVLRTDVAPASEAATAGQFPDLSALVGASSRAGHPVELHDEAGDLPAATARVVYRIVQEGLTNAHKHAPEAPTTVSVSRTGDGSVAVSVHNETGAAPMDLPGSGAGLVGLAERIRLVGGSLRSGPVTGEGWQLSAVVPWLDPRPEVR